MVNAISGSALFLIGSSVVFGIIWLVSGTRYFIYSVLIYLVLGLPNLIKGILFLSGAFPTTISTLMAVMQKENDLYHLLHNQTFELDPTFLSLIGNPLFLFGLMVAVILYESFFARITIKKMIKKIDWNKLRR